MKYCGILGLVLGLLVFGSGYGEELSQLPEPAFGQSAPAERAPLTAQLATYFPGVGDSSELKLASCEEGCDDVYMEGACDTCGDAACCGRSCCRKGLYGWGEFIYLNPRDSEVAFAMPIDSDSPGNAAVPIGSTAVLDPDYSPGFRIGFAADMTPCSRLGAEYTHFESSTFLETTVDAPFVLQSLVVHPSTVNATSTFLDTSGNLDIDFDLVDLDYRHVFLDGCSHSMNYLIGVRYGHLDQDFQTQFLTNSVQEVYSSVGFDGGGIRFGLEGEKHSCRSGLMVYAKAIASFVAGDFQASYTQMEGTNNIVAHNSWQAGRVVSMADLELGGGWVSRNGCVRLTAGYTFSKWFNTVMVDEYIKAVQENDYVGLGDEMTFDGLVARAELRY